jgi:putative MATE family efflux protein
MSSVTARTETAGRAGRGAPGPALARKILEGPIAATLLRLSAPTLVVVLMQAGINVIETYFVGQLGTAALAGVSLVFPALMLMTMMAAGGMGGAVASAVARALGANRQDDAEAIVVHALLVATALGLAFSVAALWGGPALYRAMGGRGEALTAALRYSNIIFAGATAFWLLNALGAVLRGTGNMFAPAAVSVAGALVLIPLSPALIMGWGFLPRLGVSGGAWAIVAYYVAGTVALLAYFRSGRSAIRLRVRGARLRRDVFAQILGVGAVSALMTVQSNFMVIVTTGLVGSFGTAALAGYGLASRLDYLLVPFLFALGTSSVTMVGIHCGAGQVARAERIAWISVAIGGGLTQVVGLLVALRPSTWLGLFTADPAVLSSGGAYLRIAGPFYGCVGAGLLMFFASQGAGRMRWPFLGSLLRFAIVVGGGWFSVAVLRAGLPALFAVVAASTLVFGVVNVLAVRLGAWRHVPRSPVHVRAS